MNRIFNQTVTAVASSYGMLCTMYHRMQSSNLLQRDRTWSKEFATCPSAVEMPADSAELPSIPALIAEDKRGHWLISAASLNLCVGAALPLALATGE